MAQLGGDRQRTVAGGWVGAATGARFRAASGPLRGSGPGCASRHAVGRGRRPRGLRLAVTAASLSILRLLSPRRRESALRALSTTPYLHWLIGCADPFLPTPVSRLPLAPVVCGPLVASARCSGSVESVIEVSFSGIDGPVHFLRSLLGRAGIASGVRASRADVPERSQRFRWLLTRTSLQIR